MARFTGTNADRTQSRGFSIKLRELVRDKRAVLLRKRNEKKRLWRSDPDARQDTTTNTLSRLKILHVVPSLSIYQIEK